MAHTSRQAPVGPVLVSLLLVLVGAVYLVHRRPGGVNLTPADAGAARVVSWDLTADDAAGLSSETICSVLAELNADVVCLQGVPGADRVAAIGGRLGSDWKSQALPGPSGRYLVVLAGPRLDAVAYHLIPTPAGDAIALTLRRPGRPAFHVVCLNAAADVGDAETRDRYVRGLLGWCDAHPAALTVLGGQVHVENEARRRLTERFTDACVSAGRSSEIRVAPPAAVISQAGTVDCAGSADADSALAIADVGLP